MLTPETLQSLGDALVCDVCWAVGLASVAEVATAADGPVDMVGEQACGVGLARYVD